ncbi:ATP-grasp domain-containing protein [Dokdonella sp.]|uniref:ATP-grasp domain-containing protein n=1 Tax=Dokdonella sp. TaxID=2291710 RepID=UPI0027B94E4B|nr:ATP-grasp domain-containing protein [Dokdonella sp.]
MSKVLLVDTNFSSAPLYQELIALGHVVHVVGSNPNDCLAKLSPNYWEFDYSDTKALTSLIDRERYAFLVPGCTDRSYLACVAVGKGRFPGLDSSDSCDTIFNKGRFRGLAERLGLPGPRRLAADSLPAHWPVIVKPVDAFSGKGITVLQEGDALNFARAVSFARSMSPSHEHLVERYVEGQLFSHSAFLGGRKVIRDFVVREDSSVNPFVVDTSRVVTDAPTHLLRSLRRCVETLAGDLELTDGLLHTQFIAKDDALWLIEMTRRCPGDLYSQLIELATGYPYCRSYLQPFLGLPLDRENLESAHTPIMRHTVTVPSAQDFSCLRFKMPLRIERWVPLARTGDHLQPSPKGRIGVLFCRSDGESELERIYTATLKRDLYEVCQ